jgi:predicted DNA-binding transcriptional regulator AlpA
MTSVTIYLAGGAFIGVGFQPILYYLIAVSIAAKEYWRWTMMGYYTEEEVCGLFKVGSETIRRWERDQGFPQRVDLSGHHRRRKGFLVEEVGAWDARRRNARRAVPHDDSPSE